MTDEAKGPASDRELIREPRGGLFARGGPGGPGQPPSVPTPEQCRIAKKVCRLGATDQELASVLEISVETLKRWMVTDEEFSLACRVGGDMADARVERGLYNRAVGLKRTIKKEALSKDGEIVELITIEELAPDVAASSRWLEARKRKDWGVKSVHTHEGEIEVRNSRATLASVVARAIKANSTTPAPAKTESDEQ